MNEDECSRELRVEIEQLKAKLDLQQGLLSGREKWQGDQLYTELHELEQTRSEKQSQYKSLMRDHFKFSKASALQRQGDAYLEQKLKKMVTNATHEIDHMLYSRASKSSISSSSSHSNVEYGDWLQQEKQEQSLKQQERILQEIKQLQKIIESMK